MPYAPLLLAFWLPPAHPILVNFTAALIPAAIVSDWLGRLLKKESLAAAGWWMILYAALLTPFTAYAGWDWMHDMGDMDHWQLAYHEYLGFALATATVGLAIWRGVLQRRTGKASWLYLVAATVILAALVVQGDLGGQMTFGTDQAPSPASAPASAPAQ